MKLQIKETELSRVWKLRYEIIIETEEQETKIESKNISQIKTVYNW